MKFWCDFQVPEIQHGSLSSPAETFRSRVKHFPAKHHQLATLLFISPGLTPSLPGLERQYSILSPLPQPPHLQLNPPHPGPHPLPTQPELPNHLLLPPPRPIQPIAPPRIQIPLPPAVTDRLLRLPLRDFVSVVGLQGSAAEDEV